MKYAVIDIGSNSVRLMINENGVTLYKKTTVTRLAENMSGEYLSPESIFRTVTAVKSFYSYSLSSENCKPLVFATEAVRSCKNAQDFLKLLPFDVDVISSETEAEIAYLGAKSCFCGTNLIIDIGGASTEIVVGSEEKILYAKSRPVGVVRILNACGQERTVIDKYTQEQICEYGEIPKYDMAIVIGGTGLNLVACINGIVPYEPEKVHKKSIELRELVSFCDKVEYMSFLERERLGVNEKRADMIFGGGLLLKNIMQYIKADKLYASESDNLEGYLEFYERKN